MFIKRLHELQLSGIEKHAVDVAEQLPYAHNRRGIYLHALFIRAADAHFDMHVAVTAFGKTFYFRAFLSLFHQLVVLGRPRRITRTEQKHRFGGIGLALRVRPGEDVHAAVEEKFLFRVISEIFQVQGFYQHNAFYSD